MVQISPSQQPGAGCAVAVERLITCRRTIPAGCPRAGPPGILNTVPRDRPTALPPGSAWPHPPPPSSWPNRRRVRRRPPPAGRRHLRGRPGPQDRIVLADDLPPATPPRSGPSPRATGTSRTWLDQRDQVRRPGRPRRPGPRARRPCPVRVHPVPVRPRPGRTARHPRRPGPALTDRSASPGGRRRPSSSRTPATRPGRRSSSRLPTGPWRPCTGWPWTWGRPRRPRSWPRPSWPGCSTGCRPTTGPSWPWPTPATWT